MAYPILARSYQQVRIVEVQEGIEIQKYNGNGVTYNGTMITVRDLGTNKADDITINTGYLNLEFQAPLKATIQALKPGQEVTVLKQKTCPPHAVEGMTQEEAKEKKVGFWGVSAIFDGKIVPPAMQEPTHWGAGVAAAAPAAPKDLKGIAEGNVKNVVSKLLDRKKFLDEKVRGSAISKVAELKFTKEAEFAEKTGANAYLTGITVSDGLKAAAENSKTFAELAEYVDAFIYGATDQAKELVVLPGAKEDAPSEPAPAEDKEPAESQSAPAEDYDAGSDVPF